MYFKIKLCQCDSEGTGRKWLIDGESRDIGDAQSIGAETVDEEYDSIDDPEEVEGTYSHDPAHAGDVTGNSSAGKRRRISTSCKWSRRGRLKKRRILLNEVSM